MKPLKAHLLVCTSCTYKKLDGSESTPEEAYQLRKCLKKRAKEAFPKDEVRVTAVNCLDECDDGIATVFYPQGEWHLNQRPEDEDKLFNRLSELAAQVKE